MPTLNDDGTIQTSPFPIRRGRGGRRRRGPAPAPAPVKAKCIGRSWLLTPYDFSFLLPEEKAIMIGQKVKLTKSPDDDIINWLDDSCSNHYMIGSIDTADYVFEVIYFMSLDDMSQFVLKFKGDQH